jgi:hypothetical protein
MAILYFDDVQKAVEDDVRSMSMADIEFALNYQILEPVMRTSMEREVNRRKGRGSSHTGFTSRDGSLVIPTAELSWADKLKSLDWAGIAAQERLWMDSIISKEITLEIDKEAIAAITQRAFSSGIKSMYYKRSMPPPGLLPAPTGFTEAPEPSGLASLLDAYKMRNSNDAIDALIAADKDLQVVTPSWASNFQSIGRAFRSNSAAAGEKVAFFDTESTFDFSKYESLGAVTKKEYIMDNDISFMYPHTIKILDYPGLLHAEASIIGTPKSNVDLWQQFRDINIEIQPAHTAIKARMPDASVNPNQCTVAEGIHPVTRPTFEMKVLKNREFGGSEPVKFDLSKISAFSNWASEDNTKLSSEEDLADTMSLIFSTKEDA